MTHQTRPGLLWLAWTYVALRVAHSLIHLTTNNVMHRLTLFGISNVVLVTMWIRFLRWVA